MNLKGFEFRFIVGSQDLYGDETLRKVSEHAKIMADEFNADPTIPCTVVLEPTAITPQTIRRLFEEANAAENCAGIITWMHTFSPSKMWINGLNVNRKPLLHLHTQYNRDIPWSSIDMDFMNLNQSAHGDREHGHIHARMRLPRKVVAGFWKDGELRRKIGVWMRAAAARHEGHSSVVVRIGDNMREVAVTEGDKVEAQVKLGWQVNTWGVGDLAERYAQIKEHDAEHLVAEYSHHYDLPPSCQNPGPSRNTVIEQAKIELTLRGLLESEKAGAFTTTFQDLHGLPQLPGLACQNLMQHGYGFGAEGDWKQAMLVHSAKVMAHGLPGGVSFMEDYTYHFEPGKEASLGSHMLEICPSIASTRPKIEIHPLGIGGKADPARLIFDARPGPALLVTLIDLGDRFRMIINEIETIKIENEMPKLPVARALWKPAPSLSSAGEMWILAGGTHHSVYTDALTSDYFIDWAEMNGIECILIDNDANPVKLKDELRWNEAYWSGRR
ncbi:MAG: L-arabinose isomerase [Treponema sp.]|nr:L-arabinose isomerase [Treponema sp.]